jgi:hypothetical protein
MYITDTLREHTRFAPHNPPPHPAASATKNPDALPVSTPSSSSVSHLIPAAPSPQKEGAEGGGMGGDEGGGGRGEGGARKGGGFTESGNPSGILTTSSQRLGVCVVNG